MTREELDRYLATLSDAELADRTRQAAGDLQDAADNQHDSEWHGACFAAAVVYFQEKGRRKRERPNVGANRIDPARRGNSG